MSRRASILATLPALLLLFIAVFLPILRVLALGFMRVEWAGEAQMHWAGIDSHARLWQDGRWWAAVRNTLVFTVCSVALETVLGVAIAFLLDRPLRARAAVRALVLVPWALPTAVMALAWAWIFNDAFGVANDLLLRAGLVGEPVAWLASAKGAMASIVLADVWKTTPFVALIVLAGLQGLPDEVLEAARVGGLSALQRLRWIVLPLLAPSILVAVAFRAVQSFGAFDIIYVMTGGGPGGSTETIALYAFRNFFRYLDFPYGAAIAVQGVLLMAALALAGRLAAGARSEA